MATSMRPRRVTTAIRRTGRLRHGTSCCIMLYWSTTLDLLVRADPRLNSVPIAPASSSPSLELSTTRFAIYLPNMYSKILSILALALVGVRALPISMHFYVPRPYEMERY
jgi:hypothetical protein